jgi:hypothetical protein
MANQGQFANQQGSLANQLMQQSQGQGPSAAQNMLQQAQNTQMNQNNAMAASARGGVNPALLARNVMNQNAVAGQNTNAQAATMRSQEQLGAQNSLANVLNQGQATQLGYQNLGLSQDQSMLNAQMEAQKINAGIAQANTAAANAMTSGALSGASSMMAMSDENLKKNVKDGSNSIQSFLDHISAKKYKYKDEKDGKGSQVSVMAQDLEKSPVGKQMVVETGHGKGVDYGKGFAAILAAQADMHKRMKDLEGRA